MATEREVRKRFNLMKAHLDERLIRLWAGAEALAHGDGGREMVRRTDLLAL